VIGGTRFRWEAGDILVAPSWAAVEHGAETDVDVLEISDEPVLRALHLLRECSHDTSQAVETDFHALEAVTT
jgi:gentisate 1,2-dioxygenase